MPDRDDSGKPDDRDLSTAASDEARARSDGEQTGGGQEAGAPDGEPDAEPAFLNRAARRARGKGGAAPHQTPGRGSNPPGRGPAQSRRQWGNRRTGG
ncbi:hypothetical protein [Rugosimonospora africana]|uniref:Uncharacterized protein n=1 Tax=Rugosimonospora africana TaxID=556532 RepID=A0A8J3VRR4_9ACTN|nr:hypothetical protein [Rugosimonospora africana]GIH16389.1 hypothetical protein Raf01_45610 [Rugosimonospora africana]